MIDAALVLPRRVAVRILGEAQTAQPSRISGLVAADTSGPVSFVRIRNAAPQPETAIVHSGDDLSLARMALDGRGCQLWAYVTSHPATAAIPSVREVLDSPFPDALQLVVSLSTKGVLEMRAWERHDAQLRERTLKVFG
ncbi:MAG TPA: hypothetical protein VM369_04110 [Candidatus Binatia bacterium]|nr:hypothetical protein [Candidatus Binatia bacterium]